MQTPTLRLHKPSGRAYAWFGGKRHYFGQYGTEDAQQRFQRWLAQIDLKPDGRRHTTVLLLSARFMKHAEQHYRDADGNPTGEAENIRLAMNTAARLFGNCPVTDFGPLKLQAVRQRMIEDGLSRNTINARIRRIRTVFRWGVSQQMVPPAVLMGLEAVQGLQAGRTAARETGAVQPVPELDFKAVEPHVSRQVWGLLRFIKLTGARPGEAVTIRWCDIDAEGGSVDPAWPR